MHSRPLGSTFEPMDALEPRALLAAFPVADFAPLSPGDRLEYQGSLNGQPATAVADIRPGGPISGTPTRRFILSITPDSPPAAPNTPATTLTQFLAHTTAGYRMFRQRIGEPDGFSVLNFAGGQRLSTRLLRDFGQVRTVKAYSSRESDGDQATGNLTTTTTSPGLENITVAAGSFEALRVVTESTFSETRADGTTATGSFRETRWLVRGVGPVRIDFAFAMTASDGEENTVRFNLGLTTASRLTGVNAFGVQWEGVQIAHADSSPSTIDGTFLPDTNVDGQTITRTYAIRNTTQSAITLSGTGGRRVEITGPGAGDFRIVTQPPRILQPGASGNFTVSFDPSQSGRRDATIAFRSTAQGAQPFTFTLAGNGVAAGAIAVRGPQGQTINDQAAPNANVGTAFGGRSTNAAPLARTFTIANTGPGQLTFAQPTRVTITGDAAGDFLLLSSPASSVASGGFTTFRIAFDPSTTGRRTALVSIFSSDWRNPLFTFSLQGTGV